jgi:hypothetical protein
MLRPYRIELLDEDDNHVWEHVIHCEHDGDAIDRTGRLAHPYAMRVSQAERFVARFEAGRGRRI